MTKDERTIMIEKLRLEILESYKAKAFWSYSVGVWIDKIPSYKKSEPIKEEIILLRSNWPFYLTVLFLGSFLLYMVFKDVSFAKVHYGRLLFPLIVFSIISAVVFYYKNKSVKQIIINRIGITCNEVIIPWTDIFQVYTTVYSFARGSRIFLCIALNDYSFKEFEVSNCAYTNIGYKIEHYRETYIDVAT